MNSLSQVPKKFYNLPFHIWFANNTPVNVLREEAHEMLWHQRLIHLAPQTLRQAHCHCDGIPNLSKFKFNDVMKCTNCLKANQTKNTPSTRSLMESISHPYQSLFVDFGFSSRIYKDKEGKIIESSCKDIEGLNGETAWILISDAMTKMLHVDKRLSISSPLKYLESFLQEYYLNMKHKFVELDQGGELYRNLAVVNLF